MQVVASLSDVKNVLLDDFLSCGNKQLFILERSLDTQTKWMLSDYGTIREEGRDIGRSVDRGTESSDNIVSAIEALQIRLQVWLFEICGDASVYLHCYCMLEPKKMSV